jgi:hypothetical protein
LLVSHFRITLFIYSVPAMATVAILLNGHTTPTYIERPATKLQRQRSIGDMCDEDRPKASCQTSLLRRVHSATTLNSRRRGRARSSAGSGQRKAPARVNFDTTAKTASNTAVVRESQIVVENKLSETHGYPHRASDGMKQLSTAVLTDDNTVQSRVRTEKTDDSYR